MDNLFIFGIILLIVLFLAIIFFIHRQNHTIHKIKPTIITPSYWITPTGRSWYPPSNRYPYLYSSPIVYRSNSSTYYKEPSSSPKPPSARYVKSINFSKIPKQPKSMIIEQFL